MQHGKYRFIVGFLVAPLALYAIFVIWPFVQSIYYSFTDWTGLSSDFKMVGFDNYSRMLDDDIFWKSLQHSVLLALLLPLVTLGLALFFAFMLNVGGRRRKNAAVAGVRGSAFYKIVYFFPQVLSIVIVALLFQFAFNPTSGMLNATLKAVGLKSLQPDWLGDPDLALYCVMVVLIWSTVGFFVVLFSAGMASIPKDFYEAALLDGARPHHDVLQDHAAAALGHRAVRLGLHGHPGARGGGLHRRTGHDGRPGRPRLLHHRPAAVRLPDGLPGRPGRLRHHDRCRRCSSSPCSSRPS